MALQIQSQPAPAPIVSFFALPESLPLNPDVSEGSGNATFAL